MVDSGKSAPKKLERVIDRIRFGLRDYLEKKVIISDHKHDYIFACTSRLEVFRAKTLFIKEEGTCAFIQDELRPDDVFYDIGANIGIYSILAGCLHRGSVRVYSFEPHAVNFLRLCRNIAVNGLGDTVHPLSLALSDKSGLSNFEYLGWDAATSGHQLATEGESSIRAIFTECKYSCCLDELIEAGHLPPPNIVKLDVDGIEEKIIRGMERLLQSDQRPRLIQTEVDKGEGQKITDLMASYGYIKHGYHVSAGGRKKLARGKTLDEIVHNLVFAPA